jgi:hypothetical protein
MAWITENISGCYNGTLTDFIRIPPDNGVISADGTRTMGGRQINMFVSRKIFLLNNINILLLAYYRVNIHEVYSESTLKNILMAAAELTGI